MANVSILYAYQKKKKDIGKWCEFTDSPASVLVDIQPDAPTRKTYRPSQRSEYEAQNTPSISECCTNTTRKASVTHGQLHLEGCWAKDVDIQDIEHRLRYRKKAEKEDTYMPALKSMTSAAEMYIRQNNAVNIYESYFSNIKKLREKEADNAAALQVLTVFGDPLFGDLKSGRIPSTKVPRTACALAWQPVEGPHGRRLAVAYSNLRNPYISTSAPMPGESLASHVWDPVNSNSPDFSLDPPSQLCALEFNPKDLHILGGGCHNGVVCCFDCRRGGSPVYATPLFNETGLDAKTGAADSVGAGAIRSIQWLQTSGRGQEMVTINGTNICRIWDIRSLKDPIDVIKLSNERITDALAMHYEPTTSPNKVLIGTSTGTLMTCNRKGKTADDRVASFHKGHHGPVYSCAYSPHLPKVFLSCGDWTARVWHEDFEDPLIVTAYKDSPVVDIGWHPQHPGVFVTALMNGTVEVHNLTHKLCDPLITCQASNDDLHCLKMHPEGEKLALGTSTGKVYLTMLSPSLLEISPYSIGGKSDLAAEKEEVEELIGRETRRSQSARIRNQPQESVASVQGKPPPTDSELLELTAVYIHELEQYSAKEGVRYKIAKIKDTFLATGKQAEHVLKKVKENIDNTIDLDIFRQGIQEPELDFNIEVDSSSTDSSEKSNA